jgi:hypothetical protein
LHIILKYGSVVTPQRQRQVQVVQPEGHQTWSNNIELLANDFVRAAFQEEESMKRLASQPFIQHHN